MSVPTLEESKLFAAEEPESRKRSADGIESGDIKRANVGDVDVNIKILIPGSSGGAIIGKGGSTISSMQTSTGARVKMSQNTEFFPGTQDRTCLVSAGNLETVMAAMDRILNILRESLMTHSASAEEPQLPVKIAIPNAAAGAVIGKAGCVIRELQDSTGCRIHLATKDPAMPDVTERVCSLTGLLPQVRTALIAVLGKVIETGVTYSNTSTNYNNVAQSQAAYGNAGAYGMRQQAYQAPPVVPAYNTYGYQAPPVAFPQGGVAEGETTMSIPVADAVAGGIVGRGGSTIQQLQQSSGARIRVSQRDGSGGDRTVTISGLPAAVQYAHILVQQKIAEASQPRGY